jgi:hypothetical protein
MPDYFDCNNGCGQWITFDENICSKTVKQQDSKPLTASDLTVSSQQVRYIDSLGRAN